MGILSVMCHLIQPLGPVSLLRMTFPELLDLNGLVGDDSMPPTPGPKTEPRELYFYVAPLNYVFSSPYIYVNFVHIIGFVFSSGVAIL